MNDTHQKPFIKTRQEKETVIDLAMKEIHGIKLGSIIPIPKCLYLTPRIMCTSNKGEIFMCKFKDYYIKKECLNSNIRSDLIFPASRYYFFVTNIHSCLFKL